MTRTTLLLTLVAPFIASACVRVSPTELPSPPSPTSSPVGDETATSGVPPAETPAPTQTWPPSFATPTEVEIPGDDGLTLRGVFTPGIDGHGAAVLMLHMYAADRTTWTPLVEALASAGIASLAIDLRGHGQTEGDEDWVSARKDVAATIAFLRSLPGVDPEEVGIAGASIGANLSLVQAAADPESVAAVALLSPGLDYFRVRIDGLAGQVGDVPLFLAAAEDDRYSAETVRTIAAQSSGTPDLLVYEGVAHGTGLFTTHPEIIERLSGFFREALEG